MSVNFNNYVQFGDAAQEEHVGDAAQEEQTITSTRNLYYELRGQDVLPEEFREVFNNYEWSDLSLNQKAKFDQFIQKCFNRLPWVYA